MRLASEDDLAAAKAMAGEVVDWVAKSSAPDHPWKGATEGEALAYLGRYVEAIEKYRATVTPKPPAWALASMYRQAKSIGHLLQAESFRVGIERIFRG